MSIHKWRTVRSANFGETQVPFAQVGLRSIRGDFENLVFQIDSGASISLLGRSVADLLGLRLTSGRHVQLTSVGGQTSAFVHSIQARFAEHIVYPVQFAIADSESVPNLLGRLDVFDKLQIDFDATLSETRITAPWMDANGRRVYEFLIDTERHLLARWQEMQLPDPAPDVVRRFVNRMGQLYAGALGLVKLHRCYSGALYIRAMFELWLQFEYLMQDPGPRASLYREFTHIARHRQTRAIAEHPDGPISRGIAESPLRAAGQKRNEAEYDRVAPVFARGRKRRVPEKWYGMKISELAEFLGYAGEYRVVYAVCSAWAHGDPFSTQELTENWFCQPEDLFTFIDNYYARMLLCMAERGKILLSAEQYGGLKAFVPQFH